MVRGSSIASAIAGIMALQSACVTTKTKTRKDPIYEMRRVQVGTRDVRHRERIQVGERPVTTMVRVPIEGESEAGPTAPMYEERPETTMEPIFEERTILKREPRFEWQQHLIRMDEHKYEVAETHVSASILAVIVAAPFVALTIIFLGFRGS